MSLENMLNTLIKNSDELVNREINKRFTGERTITRRFNITSTAELVGVSPQSIYAALKDGRLSGELFDNWSSSTGANIYQIDAMRNVFGTHPTKDHCLVQAVSGHKGGGWKTTISAHEAQWLALLGYRVLLVSMDAQGSLNLMFGMLPDVHVKEENTLLPFFRGEEFSAKYAIQKTYWPGLDIIPSCLQFAKVEDEIVAMAERDELPFPAHLLLDEALNTIKQDYDLIIVDGPPNLGLSTVNSVFAADIVTCPCPADFFGYYSTRQYLQMLKELLQPFDIDSFQPQFRIIGTHVDNAKGAKSKEFFYKMRESWGAALLDNPIIKTSQVPNSYDSMRTIYEQDSGQRTSYSAFKKATGIFDPVFQEMLDKLLIPMWGE